MQPKRVPTLLALLAPFLLLTAGCHRAAKAPVLAKAPVSPVIAPALGTPLAPFVSPSGKTYARTFVARADDDEPLVVLPVPPGAAPNMDSFQGSARKAAKLSIASGAPQSFTDLGAVLDSLIPDEQMRAMNISKGPDSGRLPQEQTLATVTAFIYAASREGDNDFHCVVGPDPAQPARFMNVEVAALPASGAPFFAPLRTARNQFKAFFTANGDALPARGYHKYEPPIPIRVTGSLFFDVDHVPPAVGPQGMKPQTAWEIHPVSDIQFEP